MPLLDTINEDLKTAMRAKDELRLSVLRMLKSAITNWEIANSRATTDEDVQKIIGTQVKQRREAATQFLAGARAEMAAHEEAEAAILITYLPPQLDEAAVRTIVSETIAETGVTSKSEKGKLMGALMPKLKGKADGALVARLVDESLS